MRFLGAFVGVVLLSACASEAGLEAVECTSRFDCSKGEVCTDGMCMVAPSEMSSDAGTARSQADAQVTVPADSGVLVEADAGAPVSADSGLVLIEDAGVAFTTIQDAIDRAAPGELVEVPAGAYTESLVINKALTLRGEGAAAVTVTGLSATTVLQITAANVFLEGLTFEGNGGEGVFLSGRATFTDVTVKNATGAAIRVQNGGSRLESLRLLVSRVFCEGACTPNNWGEGIVLDTGTEAVLVDTNIEDPDYIGILVGENASLSMQNGWILRAGRTRCPQEVGACAPGIASYAGATITLDLNTWIQESGGSGIHTYATTLVSNGSRIENNGMRMIDFVDGIRLEDSSATLTGNIISGNLGFGVACQDTYSEVVSCASNTHELNGQGWTNGCTGC